MCKFYANIFKSSKTGTHKWSNPTLQETQCNVINVTSLRHSLLINMPFMNEDKLSIKLHQEKGWGTKRICKEFSNKNWTVSSVRDLLRKIDTTNSVFRKAGSGWPRTVRTEHPCSWTDMQSGRQIWIQQKSPRYWKVERNIRQFCAWICKLSTCWTSQLPTTHQQSSWSVAFPIKSTFTEGTLNSNYLTVWLLYAAVSLI